MGIGTLTSILAGITFPFFLMYFGQITDMFNDPTTASDKGLEILYKFLIIGFLYWVLSKLYILFSLCVYLLLELLWLDSKHEIKEDLL